jgi:hypothetical protein
MVSRAIEETLSMEKNGMRSFWIMLGFLIVCMLSCSHGVMAQDLKVLVLDALDGKPQANVGVEYFCTRPQHNSEHKKAQTGNDGFTTFSNPCSAEEEIEISIYPPNKKEQCGVGPVTLKEILSAGVVAQPDAAGGIWCPAKVSKTLKPVPGQVIMFVKKPTWWQSHVAG